MGGTNGGDAGAGAGFGGDAGAGAGGGGFIMDGAAAGAYTPGMFNVASLPMGGAGVEVPSVTLTGGDGGAALGGVGDAKVEALPQLTMAPASGPGDANLVINKDGKHEWTGNAIGKDNVCKVWVDDAAKANPENVLNELKVAKSELEAGKVAALNGGKATLDVPDSAKKLPEYMQTKAAVDAAAAEKAAEKAAADKAAADKAAAGDEEDTSGDEAGGGGGGGGGGGCDSGGDDEGGAEGGTEGGGTAARSLDGKGVVDGVTNSANGANPITAGNFFGRAMSPGMYSAFSAIGSADADGDGKISPEEQAAYDQRVKNFQKYQDEHPDEVKQFKDNMDKMGKDLDADSQKSMKDFSDKISSPLANKDSLIKFAGVAKLHQDALSNPSVMNEAYAKKMQDAIKRDMPDLNKAILTRAVANLKLDLAGPGESADEAAKTAYRTQQDQIQAELEKNAQKF